MAEQTNQAMVAQEAQGSVYWKESDNLSLATFNPDKDIRKCDSPELKKRAIEEGMSARNGINATLLEIFKEDNTFIPERVRKDAMNMEGFQRMAVDEQYRNENTYPARARVTAEAAFYTKDTTDKNGVAHKKDDPVLKKDGTQIINLRADFILDTEAITLNLSPKGDITNISARMGIEKNKIPTFIKKEDIANSNLCKELKHIAATILEGNYIREFGPKFTNEALNKAFFDAKTYFKEHSEEVEVTTKAGQTFKGTKSYAIDASDEFGPKITLANRDDKDTIYQLGIAIQKDKNDNKVEFPYVKATHFVHDDAENKTFAQYEYLNSKEGVDEFITVPEINDVVNKFIADNALENSLYAVAQNLNRDLRADGFDTKKTYVIANRNTSKNNQIYESISFVDEGMAVARISRNTAYQTSPIYTVEAFDSDRSNRAEGEPIKTALLSPQNVRKLIPNEEIANRLEEFMKTHPIKTNEDREQDR